MFGDTCNSFMEYVAHHLFTVAAVTALFLPLFGPLLDHHFAERQPSHAHIYLDGPVYEHLHSFEKSDDHHPSRPSAEANAYGGQAGDVVILTDVHGIGSGPAGTPAYLRAVASLVLRDEGDLNRFALSQGTVSPRDIAIQTPKQPPRF